MKTAKAAHTARSTPPSLPEPLLRIRRRNRRPRQRAGDWAEKFPSREHIPIPERMAESIEISSRLSKLPLLGREQPEDVLRMVPGDLVPDLLQAKIDFVLGGAHGVGGWLVQTRATQDVDFIIRTRDKKKACEIILKKYPDLELEKHPDVWRFKVKTQYLVDLIFTNTPLFKRVINEFEQTKIAGRAVKIPKLEAALAMKFASMVGHYRPKLKKMQDGLDFMSMVEANANINLEFLRELGELVYPGGGAEVVNYVDDARNGRRLEI